MTRNEFIRRFPNASESTIAANCPEIELPAAESECAQANVLAGAVSGEAESLKRPTVRIIFWRKRPLDRDNYSGSGKDLLDGLRHAGLIQGDSEKEIDLQVEQILCAGWEREQTVIEIIW